MALRAPLALPAEENGLAAAAANVKVAAGKAQPSLLNQGSKRRALGDIGNIANNAQQRVTLGKDGKAVAADGATKPLTRASARALQAKDQPAGAPAPAAAAPAPRAAAPVAAAPSQLAAPVARAGRAPTAPAVPAGRTQQGVSMSSLLHSRSEAAVTGRKAPASPLPDIDSADKFNPLMAAEYVNDIYSYYKRVEPKYRVAADYMSVQVDINEKMRAILVDWLVEVHLKFKLMPETLFLTVNLIDRFLAEKQVTRKNLQLVGVTAMLIASKYEEIWAPEVRDFVYISDRAYTKEQILGMEKLMLNTLKFQLTLPTIYNFLARDLKAANMHFDKDVTMLASYLVELALVDYGMHKYSYSQIAVSALYAACRSYERAEPYPRALAKHSGYTLESIQPCVSALVDLASKAPSASLSAVFKKYSAPKYNEAAKRPAPVQLMDEAAATAQQ